MVKRPNFELTKKEVSPSNGKNNSVVLDPCSTHSPITILVGGGFQRALGVICSYR